MINAEIGEKPIRAPGPACKLHGAAVEVVQVAMPVRPSPVAKSDLKHLNYTGLLRLERGVLSWPFIS
jgi:hypothetical protein